MQKPNVSGLLFPPALGIHEHAITINNDDGHSRTKALKFIKRAPEQKVDPVVINLTVNKSRLHQKSDHQLFNLDGVFGKSTAEKAGGENLEEPFNGELFQSRGLEWRRPYVKKPLPRFPRTRIVFEKNENGRFVRRRSFGNFPVTLPDPSLRASWKAHVMKRTKRAASSELNSGRDRLRREMNAEEDLSLSQGDVSKKGSAPFCNLSDVKSRVPT